MGFGCFGGQLVAGQHIASAGLCALAQLLRDTLHQVVVGFLCEPLGTISVSLVFASAIVAAIGWFTWRERAGAGRIAVAVEA